MSALAAHPAVFQMAVIGVSDDMMGQKAGAVIALQPGAKSNAGYILTLARERLADFKGPQSNTW